jgi:Lon protease-like protein
MTLPSEAAVMALPNALLLPNTLLPLYIFEKRYREMLAHSLERERIFCIALMKPGVTDAAAPDEFFQVAGLGLVRACVGLSDGTSNLILQGLARVEFIRFSQEKPFPIACIRILKSEMPNMVESEALAVKVLELCEQLTSKGLELPPAVRQQLPHLTNPDMLSDIVAGAFVRDPFHRQRFLEELSVSERLRLLIRELGQMAA